MINSKEDLLELIKKYKLKNVIDNTQDSFIQSALFYNLRLDDESIKKFEERVSGKPFQVIITNNKYVGKVKNVVEISKDYFEQAKIDLADELYGPVGEKIKLVGITGTNGKTSTCYILHQLISSLGKSSLYIGTIGLYKNCKKISEEAINTSPSYLAIRNLINENRDVEYFIFEVSSHALSQNRFKNLEFIETGWTNLSQDHLDYHGTMENYYLEKCKIINLGCKPIIIPFSEEELEKKLIKDNIQYEISMTPLFREGFFAIEHNRKNLGIALSIMKRLNFEISEGFEKIIPPPGRMEPVEDGYNIFIDYAHTPDALESILTSARKDFNDKKLICVFGCGGDRDRSKRKVMGKIAKDLADIVIVTSDNPRTEDPQAIIDDIVSNIKSNENIHKITLREKAIEFAFSLYTKNSILIIAGKGHESYQEIGKVKFEFSDKKVVERLIKNDKENSN